MSQPEVNPFATPVVPTAVPVNSTISQVPLEQYSTVRNGLKLIYYSIAGIALMFIGLMLLLAIFGALSAGGPAAGGAGFAVVLPLLIGVGMLVCGLACMIGICMCVACPNPNEKTMATSMLICVILYIGGSVASLFFSGLGGVADPVFALIGMFVSLAGSLAYIVGIIIFCQLMNRVGNNVSSEQLCKSAKSALWWFVTALLVSILGTVLIFFVTLVMTQTGTPGGTARSMLAVFAPFMIVMAILGLGNLFKFLALFRHGIDALNPRRTV